MRRNFARRRQRCRRGGRHQHKITQAGHRSDRQQARCGFFFRKFCIGFLLLKLGVQASATLDSSLLINWEKTANRYWNLRIFWL